MEFRSSPVLDSHSRAYKKYDQLAKKITVVRPENTSPNFADDPQATRVVYRC